MNLGSVAAASARHRSAVLASTAILMMVLGGGILQLTFDDDPLKAMPRGNPHTVASDAFVAQFPGSSYASAVYFTVDPDRWAVENEKLPNRVPLDEQGRDGQDDFTAQINRLVGSLAPLRAPAAVPGPTNISDEVYMRSMETYFLHLMEEIPEMEWGITLPSQVKLVNYTNTGIPGLRAPDAAAFSLPGTDPEGAAQFSAAWNTLWHASPDSTASIVSLDWSTTRMGLLSTPDGKSLAEIGDRVYEATESYRERIRACDAGEPCDIPFNAFSPDHIIVDPRPPVAAASYLTQVSLDDALRLAPWAGAFIVASLFLAFRRVGTVAAMLLPMGLAGIGVLGMFGLIALPIHSVTLLVFPILMGNGIDFAIHMTQSYHHARRSGSDRIEAARRSGEQAGTPLAIATVTTVVGMLLLVFAPNILIAQLGTAIVVGMLLLLGISLTALPAALSFTEPPGERDSLVARALSRNASFWSRHRVAGAAGIVIIMAAAAAGAGNLDTLIVGTPAAYFPEGDAQRTDFERSNDWYYGDQESLVTNALVVQGDLIDPKAMSFLGALEKGVGELPFVKSETTLSLHFTINTWIQLRQGTAGAPAVIAQETVAPGSTFPDDRDSIKDLVDEMFDGPLATYAGFFVAAPDYQIGSVLVEIYQADTFEGLESQWNALLAKVDEIAADHPGHGLQVHVAGSTAVAYLFTKEEMPYLQTASIIGLAVTGLLVLGIRRSPRDAVTVAAVMGVAGIWWVGGLALLDIPLSIALVVPVVLIAAIGSDYALHLRFGLTEQGHGAWRTIGPAVVASAVTDLGAFLVFTQMRYGLLQDATTAAVLALAASAAAALIVVPILAAPTESEAGPQAGFAQALSKNPGLVRRSS